MCRRIAVVEGSGARALSAHASGAGDIQERRCRERRCSPPPSSRGTIAERPSGLAARDLVGEVSRHVPAPKLEHCKTLVRLERCRNIQGHAARAEVSLRNLGREPHKVGRKAGPWLLAVSDAIDGPSVRAHQPG